MRQSGIVAAAGLVALERWRERLAEDHSRARRLAAAVAERWPGAGVDPDAVDTNIVTFTPPDTQSLIAHLGSRGVLAGTVGPGTVRLVTHVDVDDHGVELAIKAISDAP
jgi:threonine aldolase